VRAPPIPRRILYYAAKDSGDGEGSLGKAVGRIGNIPQSRGGFIDLLAFRDLLENAPLPRQTQKLPAK
jgi:hypothetical protein